MNLSQKPTTPDQPDTPPEPASLQESQSDEPGSSDGTSPDWGAVEVEAGPDPLAANDGAGSGETDAAEPEPEKPADLAACKEAFYAHLCDAVDFEEDWRDIPEAVAIDLRELRTGRRLSDQLFDDMSRFRFLRKVLHGLDGKSDLGRIGNYAAFAFEMRQALVAQQTQLTDQKDAA